MTSTRRGRLVAIAGALALAAAILALLLLQPADEPRFEPLPQFAAIDDVAEMKAAFFDYLTPIVSYHNGRILQQRERLESLAETLREGGQPWWFERRWLEGLAQEYELDGSAEAALQQVEQLLRRVDIVPLELALVQAAKESGWGRSRFAAEGNNLFGQRCFRPGCGLAPSRRPDAGFEVQRFASISEAIRLYIANLNTHEKYRELRQRRARLRAAGEAVTGLALADGLLHYSTRREAYVADIKAMIEQYRAFAARRDKA